MRPGVPAQRPLAANLHERHGIADDATGLLHLPRLPRRRLSARPASGHAKVQFPGASGVLDIYHASTYIADAAKALYGEGTPEAKTWLEQGRQSLLADGWHGICAHVGATLAQENTAERQKAVESLTSYLAKHTEHLNYCLRLHQGKSIGSGMVEGAAKNMIGKRLKQTGARWNLENANKMAELCCLNYSSQWADYWMAA